MAQFFLFFWNGYYTRLFCNDTQPYHRQNHQLKFKKGMRDRKRERERVFYLYVIRNLYTNVKQNYLHQKFHINEASLCTRKALI